MRADLRQLALAEVRVAVEQRPRDHEPEHRVAEELEPLVRLGAVVRERGMAEDLLQPLAREFVDQPLERRRCRRYCRDET